MWCNFAKKPLFYSSFSLNHPVAKSVVRHGIEYFPSPKQQRRPLPSLLYLSFFYETHLQEWTLACRLLTADFKRTVEPAAAAAAGGAGAHQLSRLLARTGQLSQAGDRTWDLLRRVYVIDDIVSSYFVKWMR